MVEVTDDKSLPKAERKQLQIEHAPHTSPAAKQLKLADKICNVRDLASHPPMLWPPARRRAYRAWAAKVIDALRGTNPALEASRPGFEQRRRVKTKGAGYQHTQSPGRGRFETDPPKRKS